MPVTRLEASTTGVTLIARSRRALDELEALASRSELTHCFLALVYGQVPAAWGSDPVRLELPAKVQCKKGYKRKQLIAAARARTDAGDLAPALQAWERVAEHIPASRGLARVNQASLLPTVLLWWRSTVAIQPQGVVQLALARYNNAAQVRSSARHSGHSSTASR